MNVYRQMLDILDDGKRWCKEHYAAIPYSDDKDWLTEAGLANKDLEDVRFCLLGAHRAAVQPSWWKFDLAHMAKRRSDYLDRRKAVRVLGEIINEQFPERVMFVHNQHDRVTRFNDNQETSWDDIQVVLEKAAIKLEEKA